MWVWWVWFWFCILSPERKELQGRLKARGRLKASWGCWKPKVKHAQPSLRGNKINLRREMNGHSMNLASCFIGMQEITQLKKARQCKLHINLGRNLTPNTCWPSLMLPFISPAFYASESQPHHWQIFREVSSCTNRKADSLPTNLGDVSSPWPEHTGAGRCVYLQDQA